MTNTISFKPQINKMLLDESPLVVLPSLAAAIGLESAVVLQQLHFLIRMKMERHKDQPKDIARNIHDGRIWVWNTYDKWKETYFNFLSVRSLQRIFLALEKKGLIVSGNYNESNLNKTKWYSINYEHPLINPLVELKSVRSKNSSSDPRKKVIDSAKLAPSTSQDGAKDSTNLAPYSTKNSVTENFSNTTTTEKAPKSSLNEEKKKAQNDCKPNGTFAIPETSEDVNQIVKDVMHIIYPYGEKIRNRNNLISSMKKKLMVGILEIPEGWDSYHKVKKEKTEQKPQKDQMIDEEKAFLKSKIEFDQLPESEKTKYFNTARENAKSAASAISESILYKVAVHLWTNEPEKKTSDKKWRVRNGTKI